MRVRMLGTGSADGWPNPFCSCGSCEAERAAGRSRQPSSAAVDDVILLDCGPTTPHAASAAGLSLRSIEHVLITHGHPDHLDPAFLLSRAWVSIDHELHVWGPARAIDLCRPWLGPDSTVHLHVVAPGELLRLSTSAGDYTAQVVGAEHSSGNGDPLSDEAVLYVVTDDVGQCLLYATDTADLPDDTVAAMPVGLSIVLVDETFGDKDDHGTGHLDITTLPGLLARLRAHGAITDSTVVVATHLSHHNPPTAVLRERLAPMGVRVVDDHAVIQVGSGRPAERMLVLGGARSGKSHYAERWAATRPDVTYVATGGDRAGDAEWHARVAAHRQRRPADWRTLETIDVAAVLSRAPAASTVLVDCLALWLTGHLDAVDAWARLAAGDRADVLTDIDTVTDELVGALRHTRADVLLVSNEVGMGIVPDTASGRLFQDALGRVNARVAAACDRVVLVVAGQPIVITDRTGVTPA